VAKWANDNVMDAALNYIATADRMFVCSTQPADYAAAVATALATITLTPGDGGGDFAIADDVSGRKVTIAEQAAATVDASGDATHIALGLTTDTVLIYVTTCTTQTLTEGNTVTVPSWKVSFGDPS
jgi:hypothetical protein